MPRPATGSIVLEQLDDGTRAFRLRFRAAGERERMVLHERPDCDCGCGGGWDEPAARHELGNVLARVRAGVWRPSDRPAARAKRSAPAPAPTFHVYASRWLQGKVDGSTGARPISPRTPRSTTAGV